MNMSKLSFTNKNNLYCKLYLVNFILITILKALSCQDEIFNNENPKEKFSDFNILGIDGLLVEVDYSNLFRIMKKIDYAIVYVYNPKICRIGIECKEILEELKKASEKLYKNKPAIGLFKIRCNFVPANIKTVKKENFCDKINLTEENIPQLLFIYHGNYAFMDKSKPIFYENIINEMQNKIFLSTVSSMESKKDVKNFFENENKIKDKSASFYPIKFIFYSNKIDDEKIIIENKNTSTIDLNKIERNSTYLESLFLNSYLVTNLKAYRITNKRALMFFINYVQTNSNYVINESVEFKAKKLEDYLDEKINESLVITFDIKEEALNNDENKVKLNNVELIKINILPLHLLLPGKSNIE